MDNGLNNEGNDNLQIMSPGAKDPYNQHNLVLPQFGLLVTASGTKIYLLINYLV